MPITSDQHYLLRSQYRNADNLNARIRLHRTFSTNRYSWYRWVFDRLSGPLDAQVLEIGCGPASFWFENIDRVPADWNVTLTDFSPGMVQEAKQTLRDYRNRFHFEQADVQMLPFRNAKFDMVIANHMLYHVPDRQKAYAEIRRVLKPTGCFFAATNGQNHLQELNDVVTRFKTGLVTAERPQVSFTLEDGLAELAGWFPSVNVHYYENKLIVTDAEILKAYIASGKQLSQQEINQLSDYIEEQVRLGPFHITPVTGLFEAKRPYPIAK